jgi:acyl-homoserine-lactone acylase
MMRPALVLRFILAFMGLVSISSAAIGTEPAKNTVEIRRTSYGIPHIKAVNEKGLGYGIGYAYAEDNLCLLANEIVTVSGSRSKYFGETARNDDGIENLESDIFFRWLNAEDRTDTFLANQKPEIRNLLAGYAAGYNTYLHTGKARLPQACGGRAWLRDISERDIVKLIRRLTTLNGVGRFVDALTAAAPPHDAEPTQLNLEDGDKPSQIGELSSNFEDDHGSNSIALGRTMTQNGRGMLLGNPHFPWSGALRFYEMHLTIPGKVDVMGAALPGLPAINIGFSHDVAWSHTVDTSSHMTYYHIELDPHDPTRYLVDGQSVAMIKRQIDIEVAGKDGILEHRTHVLYETMFGPVLSNTIFGWTKSGAFTIQDANFDNDRSLEQWSSMNSAKTLGDFEKSIETTLGIPWVDTIAADKDGSVLFMNVSSIPRADAQMIDDCSWPMGASMNRPSVLDGSRAVCDWKNGFKDTRGLLDASRLPVLRRNDYVQNSNGNAWLANPAAPLTGFSPLVSRKTDELNQRTRFALDWLHAKARATENEKRVGPGDLETLLFSDKVYLASVIMDDVKTLCSRADMQPRVDLETICGALLTWDRTAGTQTSLGYLYFDKFAEIALGIPHVWSVPFEPAEPLSTPRGLNLNDPDVFNALAEALLSAQNGIRKFGLPADATWGQIQHISKSGRDISIPGGNGSLGVYNAIQSTQLPNGKREVQAGSSYIQIVSFTDHGPVAKAVLTFAESSDPASIHYSDQTELFSKSQLMRLPFSEDEITRNPEYRLLVLSVPQW